MRSITPELTKELSKHFKDSTKVASTSPYKVKTFRELVEHTAKLSFTNKDYLLFYRGQAEDYLNKAGASTYYPSIYRGDPLLARELIYRFDILEGSSKALVELFETRQVEGYKELKRRRAIQWSILQHYEVCSTPYLDFTQSLRVACSFATLDNKRDTACISVFGLPYMTNRISNNSEHDIINVRLLSICPPTALRPYFQEGYLVGTDDITSNYDSKTELDFNNRLIAKFEIPNHPSFWGREFHKIPRQSLYPSDDPIWTLCQEIRELAAKSLQTGNMGLFLQSWAELEEMLATRARQHTNRFSSVRDSIRVLYNQGIIPEDLLAPLDRLRTFRNYLVHTPWKLDTGALADNIILLEEVKARLAV